MNQTKGLCPGIFFSFLCVDYTPIFTVLVYFYPLIYPNIPSDNHNPISFPDADIFLWLPSHLGYDAPVC